MSTVHEQVVRRILSARVYDVSEKTRLQPAPLLSQRLGCQVLLKREDEQPVFSFKCRGAYNRIHKLHAEQGIEGVIAASAGNHAQGVALAAQALGLESIIVMPVTTPSIKVEAVRQLGAEVVLHGDDFEIALEHAHALVKQYRYSFIHPFDDPETIAGQGTIGVEICQQYPNRLDAIYVPVGGGGLAAGVAAYIKYLRPSIRVVGVEPVDAACMHAALKAGAPVKLPTVGLFADGVAVRQAGAHTFELCREFLDEVVLVSVDEMATAIKDIFSETRTLVEPSGALALAGLKRDVAEKGLSGQTLIAIVSGANINFDRLRHVAERAEIGESREALFAVRIPERPGSFLEFLEALGPRAITEFNYRYADRERACVFAGVEVSGGKSEREAIIDTVGAMGHEVMDMTHNDTAKLHIRHMIGGHAQLPDERFFRFRFPERPGALLNFLRQVAGRWNITLFHYRNHGAAYGRVLIGMDVPPSDNAALAAFIEELGYPVEAESGNAAVEIFLR